MLYIISHFFFLVAYIINSNLAAFISCLIEITISVKRNNGRTYILVNTISNEDSMNPLGKGSYYLIYKATGKNRQNVAIKIIKITTELSEKTELSENQIAQGIEIMGKIAQIPNVGNLLQCADFIKEDKCYYIIMPYHDAGNLTSLISTGQIQDEQQAVEYFRQICYGVQILHSQDIIHRDLKTDIIYLSHHSNPLYLYNHYLTISDFELYKKGLYNMTLNVGTSYTMEPEVKTGDYRPNVDVY